MVGAYLSYYIFAVHVCKEGRCEVVTVGRAAKHASHLA